MKKKILLAATAAAFVGVMAMPNVSVAQQAKYVNIGAGSFKATGYLTPNEFAKQTKKKSMDKLAA